MITKSVYYWRYQEGSVGVVKIVKDTGMVTMWAANIV